MEIIRVKDAVAGGKEAFKIVSEGMTAGAKVLGLATGSTPIPLYTEMRNSSLDFSEMVSVNLDEYIGLSGDDPQSYRYFMNQQLFDEKTFKCTYVPNGNATDVEAECQRYDEVIEKNPIDIQILGIGANGHIGFNEPGTSFDSLTHRVQLTESTINANKRFFEKEEDVPREAISMGIQSVFKGKKMVMMAYGKEKAEAVKGMVEGPITEDLPASILQKHPDVVLILDEEAAGLL